MGLGSGNLSENVKLTRVSNAVAAGTSTINSSSVDMKEFTGCRFIVGFGTITAGAVTSINVETSNDDGSADSWTELAGTGVTIADSEGSKISFVDIYKPRERYLRCTVERATQNAVVDFIIAEQYAPSIAGTTDDSSTVVTGEVHVSPAEGTA